MEINGWKIEKIVHQCGDVAFKIENENNYFCFSDDGSDKTAILLDFFESIIPEIERLQEIIDEANAQEPVGYVVRGNFFYSKAWAQRSADNITERYENTEIDPVYAAAIPAQQSPAVGISKKESATSSPAVAVPDENAWIIEKLSYHKFERNDLNIDGCLNFLKSEWKEIQGRTPRQLVMQILDLLANTSSSRITEQDAREILESFCFEYCSVAGIDEWCEKEGRTLLNKLNK